MKVFVVIAVHNRIKFTLNCLQLLSEQTYKKFDVILVDDGSEDDTEQKVIEAFPNTIIIQGTGEWWWAKSMNAGFNYALENGGDIVITLNNDTCFAEDLIGALLSIHQQRPQSIIGCLNTVKKEEEYIFFSGIHKICWWKAKEYKYHKAFSNKGDENGLHPTVCLNGRGTLIPISVFKNIGLFDHIRFPQYAADYDFVLRAVNARVESLISWDVIVRSYIEETGKGRSFIPQSPLEFLKSFSNRYSATSMRMWTNYYFKHAGWQAIPGLICQFLRLYYSFYNKRNLIVDLK